MKEILIITPAFNEEKTIGELIKKIKGAVADCDVLVVDDGSSDSTVEAAKISGAQVISLPINLGYGAALETGYIYAFEKGYKYLVQIDADGQHEPKCVDDLLAPVKNKEADIVIGSRFLSDCNYKASFARRAGMALFAFITSRLTNKKISDSTSGFQAMNRAVISYFVTGFYPSDYPDADVLILLHRAGFLIKEVPVTMYTKNSKKSMHAGVIKPTYYIFKMFLSIGMIFLRKNK